VKKSDRLRRRRAYREPKPRFLVVCEGTVTEPCYFTAIRHVERCLIELQIEGGGAPKALVERAVALKRQAARDARREADDNLKYDEVWCVFDVDEHQLIHEAKEQAKANGVELAESNPCFELWVLLHFQD
jgi:RloB-like protein